MCSNGINAGFSQNADEIVVEGRVYFTPEECNISRGIYDLGNFKVDLQLLGLSLLGTRMLSCQRDIFFDGACDPLLLVVH